MRQFPENFLFGAATSAHQVEGGNTNSDWWHWEQGRKERLLRRGIDPAPFLSGNACDHYRLYRQDFDLAKSMHHNAHRLSIEWARVEPHEGEWDDRVIEHYRDVIAALKERGIEPVVTLHHFTIPRWFALQGGWTRPDAIDKFARYASFIAENFGRDVRWWLTINEPSMLVIHGYIEGSWPPQKQSLVKAFQAYRRLVKAHNAAYQAIKKHSPKSNVGIPYNCQRWLPASRHRYDKVAARLAEYVSWRWFLNKVRKHLDFIGLNYYFANRTSMRPPFYRRGIGGSNRSDLNWDIYPEGLYDVPLALWNLYQKPIMVTENGIADAKDEKREKFILDHLRYLLRAIEDGVPIIGYLHWSLVDNFEWTDGFAPRFGLAAVDYKTQKRTLRKSALLYAQICKTGTLPD